MSVGFGLPVVDNVWFVLFGFVFVLAVALVLKKLGDEEK